MTGYGPDTGKVFVAHGLRGSPSALSQPVALGLPFIIGGGITSIYEVTLGRWFRSVPLPKPVKEPA